MKTEVAFTQLEGKVSLLGWAGQVFKRVCYINKDLNKALPWCRFMISKSSSIFNRESSEISVHWRINFTSTVRGLTEQFQHCLFLWRSIKLHLEESFSLSLVFFVDLYFKPCILFLIYAWKPKYCAIMVIFNGSQNLQVKNSWYLKENSLKFMFTPYLIEPVYHFHSYIYIGKATKTILKYILPKIQLYERFFKVTTAYCTLSLVNIIKAY